MLRLFTGDALFAHARWPSCCACGRDYLLQIEANQGDTLDALQNCFSVGDTAAGRRNDRKKGAHEEIRQLWVDLDNADYIRESLDLPGCRLALRVDRIVRAPDGTVLSHDVRYFISSLDPDRVTAAELLQHVRHHWRLENGLHFLKDRWWDEDRHHTRGPACRPAWRPSTMPPSRSTASVPTPPSHSEPPPTISPGTPPSA